MKEITVRHSEPEDHEAVYLVYSGPRAMADTLGLPFSSKEPWRERLAEEREGEFSLVACVGGEVVGHLSVYLLGAEEEALRALRDGRARRLAR